MHATAITSPDAAATIEASAASMAARLGPRGGAEFELAPHVQMRATVTRDPISGGSCWRTTYFPPGAHPNHRCCASAIDAVRDLLQRYPGATLIRAIERPGERHPRPSNSEAKPDPAVWTWRRAICSFNEYQQADIVRAMRKAGASPETAELWSIDAPGMRQRNEIRLRDGRCIPFAFEPSCEGGVCRHAT